MSHEGVTLLVRTAVVTYLIMVATVFRYLVGPGRQRGRIMLAGTLGGISLGVLLAYPISQWLKTDVSGFGACFGMTLGWSVAWLFARQSPHEAS